MGEEAVLGVRARAAPGEDLGFIPKAVEAMEGLKSFFFFFNI